MRQALLVTVCLFLLNTAAIAGSWNISCTNSSCVASQGRIQVFWSAPMNDVYSGKLTGVEGLPIDMKDMQAAEAKVKSLVDEIAPASKKEENGEDKTGFGSDTKPAYSESVSVDYTLAFVQWLGDTKFGNDSSIKRYWEATEYILDRYTDGEIAKLMDVFFMERNSEQLMTVPVNTKVNEKNKQFLIAKWFATKKLAPVEAPATLSNAYSILLRIGKKDVPSEQMFKDVPKLKVIYGKNLDELFIEYQEDMKKVKKMMKPGLTAKKLLDKGQKDLALAMWLGNKVLMASKATDNLPPLPDLYVEALGVVAINNKNIQAAFEKGIKSNDPSLIYVAVKGSPVPFGMVIFGCVGLIGGGFAFAKLRGRKRKSIEMPV